MLTGCLIIVCSRGLSRSFVFLAIVTRALPCQVVAIRCQAVDGRASNASTVWRQVATATGGYVWRQVARE
jgi:hypothetical protein